jgi:hypothetical protein
MLTVLENPVYYTLAFTINRDNVPDLYYQSLTTKVYVGTAGSASVRVGGSEVESSYNAETGFLTFTTAGEDIEVTVKNPANPEGMVVSAAALKGDKGFAWSHGFDDNVNLAASIDLFNAKGWRGMIYLIGNLISDDRNEAWILDKPALIPLLNQGWGLGNHTWDHECVLNLDNSTFMNTTILNGYNKIMEIVEASDVPNYKVIGFAAPCFVATYDQYIEAFRSSGEIAVKYNESQGDVIMQVDVGAEGYTNGGRTAGSADSNTLTIGRDIEIDATPSNSNLIMDWMAANASANRHFWYNTLCHGDCEDSMAVVLDYAYENYGPGGDSSIWVAPSDEVYSYLLVRDNSSFSDTTLTRVSDGSALVVGIGASSVENNSATINWSTNRAASSRILFGLTTDLGSSTSETDVESRVTSHSRSFGSLIPCIKYYYRAKSEDAYEGVGLGTLSAFVTDGCLNSAAVLGGTEAVVAANLGGTMALVVTNERITVSVPAGFKDTDTYFQIKKLEKETIIEEAAEPLNSSLVGEGVFDLKAYDGVAVRWLNSIRRLT